MNFGENRNKKREKEKPANNYDINGKKNCCLDNELCGFGVEPNEDCLFDLFFLLSSGFPSRLI